MRAVQASALAQWRLRPFRQNAAPQPAFAPSAKARINRLPRPELLGQVAPRHCAPEYIIHALEHHPVILRRPSASLFKPGIILLPALIRLIFLGAPKACLPHAVDWQSTMLHLITCQRIICSFYFIFGLNTPQLAAFVFSSAMESVAVNFNTQPLGAGIFILKTHPNDHWRDLSPKQ
jgi:hypothetical protein